jgi:DNA-binding transcriptional LysR family regulator
MRNWDNLRFLLALARSRTPEAAARLLKVDESTVRRRITALEEDAGVALFDRADGNWEVTRAGTLLLASAEAVEMAVASAEARLDHDDPALAGTVRIGAPDGIGSMLLAPALAGLQKRAPRLSVELVTHGSPADISRHEVDMLVILDRPESGRHRIRRMRPVTLRVYGSRDYIDAAPAIECVDDLAAHRFIGYDRGNEYAEAAVRRLAENNIPLPSGFVCSTVFAQTRAAAGGAGLALLPSYMIEPGLDLVPVLPDQFAVTLDLWLLIHSDVASRARVRAVADVIATA